MTNPQHPRQCSADDEDSCSESRVRLAPGVNIDSALLGFSYARSSGPGGQNVNKRATKAQLRVAITALPISVRARNRLAHAARGQINKHDELIIVCDECRTQLDNRRLCVQKLSRLVLAALVEPKVRKKTRPTRGSVLRRLKAKHVKSQIKQKRQKPGHDTE